MIKEIEEIIKKVSKIMINKDNNLGIEIKEGIGNIVTKYDKEVQDELYKELKLLIPSANFIGEESDDNKTLKDNDYTFIIDPIDGTTNFSRDLNLSAISVALFKNGKPYIGVVYNPYRDELFSGQIGEGAFLNGSRINVSNRDISNGLVFTGLAPYYFDMREKSMELQRKIVMKCADYRRLGSAALELCYVACGRGEAYFETKLMPWDYAAGYIILKEAGGIVTTIEGEELKFDRPSSVLGSNGIFDYIKLLNN